MKEGLIAYFKARPSKQFVAVGVLILVGISLATYFYKPPTLSSAFFDAQNAVQGWIDAEPQVSERSVRYRVRLDKYPRTMRVLVSGDLYPRFEYGDSILFSCAFKSPDKPKQSYKDRVFSICFSRGIEKIGSNNGNKIVRTLLTFKRTVRGHLGRYVREPYLSLLGGFLYGERSTLPDDFYQALVTTGTIHIIAISGYNITLIISFFTTALIYAGFSRLRVLPIVLIGVIAFVVFVGAQASVVRAALFGILVLVGRQWGRVSTPSTLLVAAALVMAAQNPFILLYDVGFQLSFLATIGLVYVAPYFSKVFSFVPAVLGLRESCAQTVSATVVTLPMIVFVFGRFSTISIIANVAILWMVPLIMTIGFVLLFFSFVLWPVADFLGWFIEYVLYFFMRILFMFSHIPYASFSLTFGIPLLIVSYIFIFTFIWYAYAQEKNN